MADLRAVSEGQVGAPESFGPGGTGVGVDVLGELERMRHNLLALAEILEELRGRYNGHKHCGVVGGPPVGEQSQKSWTVY